MKSCFDNDTATRICNAIDQLILAEVEYCEGERDGYGPVRDDVNDARANLKDVLEGGNL